MILILFFTAASVGGAFYSRKRARRLHSKSHTRTKTADSWRQSWQTLSSGFQRPPAVRPDVRDSGYALNIHDYETPANRVSRVATPAEDDTEGVDRHTSVRSVMTLPAYSAVHRDNEAVIGREGERAGMDSVVEFPETNEEDEERREQEMEALYQIREQRRREATARNERRRLRRQARERRDVQALRELQQESLNHEAARTEHGSAAMMAEHESRPRERRVSAVDYGRVGVARHDGSRVRANSNESERPLLDAGGSLGMSGPVRPWVDAEVGYHHRGRSSASNLSMTSYGSDDHSGMDDSGSDMESITPQRSRQTSSSRPHSASRSFVLSAAGPSTIRPSISQERRTSGLSHRLDLITTTHEQSRQASPNPPEYETVEAEEAPPYESPVTTRAPGLPSSGQTQHSSTPRSVPAIEPSSRAPPPPPLQTDHGNDTSQRTGEVAQSPYTLPAILRLPSIRITEGTPIEQRARGDFPDFSRFGES